MKWKAQVVRGNRALAVPYVDARVVEDRLDAVFGPQGWQDSYEVLPNNSVVCKLRVRFGGSEWVEKSDVGSQSDQPDEGDRLKSAFSDALKRAAVKLGIGRYLYRLPQQWVDYDPQTRQIKATPTLPAWAVPVPEKTITAEQWDQIKAALKESGMSQAELLTAIGRADGVKYKRGGEIARVKFDAALAIAKAGKGALAKQLESAGNGSA